jgi:hypothetical protein
MGEGIVRAMALVCDPNEPPVFIHKPAILVLDDMAILEPTKPAIFDRCFFVLVSVPSPT